MSSTNSSSIPALAPASISDDRIRLSMDEARQAALDRDLAKAQPEVREDVRRMAEILIDEGMPAARRYLDMVIWLKDLVLWEALAMGDMVRTMAARLRAEREAAARAVSPGAAGATHAGHENEPARERG